MLNNDARNYRLHSTLILISLLVSSDVIAEIDTSKTYWKTGTSAEHESFASKQEAAAQASYEQESAYYRVYNLTGSNCYEHSSDSHKTTWKCPFEAVLYEPSEGDPETRYSKADYVYELYCSSNIYSNDPLCEADAYDVCADLKDHDAPAIVIGSPSHHFYQYCNTANHCEVEFYQWAESDGIHKQTYFTGNACISEPGAYDDCPLYEYFGDCSEPTTDTPDDTGTDDTNQINVDLTDTNTLLADLKNGVSTTNESLTLIDNEIKVTNTKLGEIQSIINSNSTEIKGAIESVETGLGVALNDQTAAIQGSLTSLDSSFLGAINNQTDALVAVIGDGLSDAKTDTSGLELAVSNVETQINNSTDALISQFESSRSQAELLQTQNNTALQGVTDMINAGFTSIINGLNSDGSGSTNDSTNLTNLENTTSGILNKLDEVNSSIQNISPADNNSMDTLPSVEGIINSVESNRDDSTNEIEDVLSDYTKDSSDVLDSAFSSSIDVKTLTTKYNNSNGFNIDVISECPTSEYVDVGFVQFEVSYQAFCDIAPMFKAILIFFATFSGFAVLIKHF